MTHSKIPRRNLTSKFALACLTGMLLIVALPSVAQAATINPITFSSDPTQDEPLTLTVSGSTEVARYLYVYRQFGTAACEATAYAQDLHGGVVTYATSLPAGAFSKSYSFTPRDAGTYRICAYVTQSLSATPLALRSSLVSVRSPNAAFNPIAFSSDPTEDEQLTLTVSGSTEVARYLYVYRQLGTAACEATAYAQDLHGGVVTYATSLPAGAFSKSYSFTPNDAGVYRICAYVTQSLSATPLALRSDLVTVRLPTATLSPITFSSDPTQDEPLTLTVSGSTEVARYLYVYRQFGTAACEATAYAQDLHGGVVTYATSLPAGAFSKSYSFTPRDAGTYRICAYVTQSLSATPLALRSDLVSVRLPSATVSIAMVPPPYLAGQLGVFKLTGEVEQPATIATSLLAGATPCAASPDFSGSTKQIAAGVFTSDISVEFGTQQAYTFCAYVLNGTSFLSAEVLQSARVVVSKQPLPVPIAGVTALGTDRKPVFTWSTGSSGKDTLVLSQEGRDFLRVTEKGAVTSFDEMSDPLSSTDDYSDEYEPQSESSSDPDIAVVEHLSNGISKVALRSPLPPGDYAWRVVRNRDAGEIAESALQSVRVHGPPLNRLAVSTRPHRGASTSRPGYTSISVRTTPFVDVSFKLSRRGKVIRDEDYTWGESSREGFRVRWSCNPKRQGIYSYVIVASDYLGHRRVRRGRFRGVSKTRCNAMRAKQRRRSEARRRADARAQQRELQRFIDNCIAIGGTPAEIRTDDGPATVCRGPYGGLLSVPM